MATTKCEHINTEVSRDDQIRCKDCGAILEYVEKKVGTATSVKAAKTMQEEMAVTGKYTASSFEDGFVVYSRVRNNIREEVLCHKTGHRSYQVLKRLSVVA